MLKPSTEFQITKHH